ncbi:lytic transglycosylase domain-containing protein [Thalassotalea ponticola]|uniref:lytic transglycosylase domain-containing protein n=1 Tax=Thalassotalea ponticola TaxID=1523392 RepID=UPI0025B3B64C|nr:lytic transglycosylase domain-containing protein [Thalassotalea ponticola]MDN3651997.1 lytic transglycosylase domain-containing protein [Thalassotalea ponticola]
MIIGKKRLTIAAFLVMAVTNSHAEQTSTKIYKYQRNGIPSFSDVQPAQGPFEIVRNDCYACKTRSTVDWQTTPLYRKPYAQQVKREAQKYHVNEALVRAIIHAESHFKADAVSKAGAVGLMQLMPKTAAQLGVVDSFNADQNIAGGTKHLAHLMKKFKGKITLIAAAYNAGEGAVAKYKGIPPYPETRVYVERVTTLYQRYLNTI